MVQAQIESIQGKGDWKGKHGTMYTFEVAFNDGTVGEANAKSQEPPYKVGDEAYYEIKTDDRGLARSSRSQRTHRPPEASSSSNPSKPKQGQANHPGYVLQGGRDGVGQPVQTQIV